MGGFIFGSGSGGGSGGGLDWSQVNMAPQFGLAGKKFFDQNKQLREGTILNWDGTVLSGASTDSNKIIVVPATSAKHILGGRYLGRDIEIAAMEAGSAAMGISGDTVTLTKQAGYIAAGSETLQVPAGSATLSRNGNVVTLTKHAGYIAEGTASETVPITTKTQTISSNGSTTITPPTGYVGLSQVNLTVAVPTQSLSVQSNRSYGTISSNGSYTIYPSSGYDAMSKATLTVSVLPNVGTGAGTVTTGDTTRTINISCPSGYTLIMAAFVASSVPGANYIVSGMVRYGSSTGRCDVQTSSGVAVGNSLTSVSFSGRTVTITCSSSYSFNGANYTAYVAYYA
ncbi:MAG: hypothetical protein J5706_07085 [Elusimicrobiales bacterium]|nr:hypothetical protein [Elusimicrobiales bacterium]